MSRTKAVRLLRWPLEREMRGLALRAVVFCTAVNRGQLVSTCWISSWASSPLGPSSAGAPLRKGRGRDPPRGETETYVTLVDANNQAAAGCGSFLGHRVECGVVVGDVVVTLEMRKERTGGISQMVFAGLAQRKKFLWGGACGLEVCGSNGVRLMAGGLHPKTVVLCQLIYLRQNCKTQTA